MLRADDLAVLELDALDDGGLVCLLDLETAFRAQSLARIDDDVVPAVALTQPARTRFRGGLRRWRGRGRR